MTYIPIVPYADPAYADAYFSDRMNTAPWDDANVTDRAKALATATRAIDNLNLAGHKAVDTWTNGLPDQPRQFPRGNDTLIPDAVAQACCELALVFLDDVDPNIEIENLSNMSQGISEAKTTRDTSYVQEHLRVGIPSIQAWALLLPFLRDTQHPRIELGRGS